MRLSRLSALLFCSGAAALILEVAWFRRMAQLAGATSVALAAVLAAVIGGMALGALLLGRRAEHSPNPLRFYGACELAVAVLAFVSPTLLVWAAPAFVGMGVLPRFLLASLLLMPAAFFMGGTLPAMAAALRARDDELGRGLGWLYAWNTFGAVTGTLLAGFFLLSAFGLQNTIRIAAVLSGLAGGIAFACKPASPSTATDAPETPFSPTDRRRAAALFAASGFLGLACEAAFVRGLVLVFGSTTYAFTTMLAVFLFGIAAGGALGTRFAHRARVLHRLETTIGVTAALFALGAVAIYFLPLLYLHLYAWLGGGFAIGIAIRFALAALVLLPGALGLGVAFPLAARVASEGQAAAGTGRLYAANTLASVAGSTCAVFFLVPFFGPMGTVAATALCTALLVVVGLRRRMTLLTLFGVAWFLTLAVAKTSLGPQAVVAMLALFTACTVAIVRRRYWLFAPALVAVAGLLPGAAIAREHFYAGVFYQPGGYLKDGAVDSDVWDAGRDVPFVEYGREATVSVLSWYGKSSLLIDGKAVATEQTIMDVHHLELLGHLPVALHENPQRVLVVGLGMGTTYRACWAHQPKTLTVVEIEEAVAAGAKRIGVRPEVPRDLIIDDARAFLRATNDLYDIITSDPIHPWVRGGGDLYTREYFELCKARLAPGGIACQWLPLYQMGLQDVKDVVRTFGEVFSGHVFFSGADMILVGKSEPWTPAVIGPQSARAALAKLGAPDPLQLRIATCEEFEGGETLTDDALRLEFSAPKQLDNPEMAAVLDWMLAAWPDPPAPFGDLVLAIRAQVVGDATALGEHLDAAQRAAPQNGFVLRYSGETHLQYVDTLWRDGNFEGAMGFLSHARKRLGDDPRLLGALADVLEAKGDNQGALQALRKLRDRVFDSAYLDRRIAKLENG